MDSNSQNIPTQSEEEVLKHLRSCLDETSEDQAIYFRIAAVLSSKISEGYFEAGEWLPSHRSLARSFDVNLTTITKSLNYLKDRGVIAAQAGKGTVVRGRALDHTPPSYDVPDVTPEIDLSVHTQTLDAVKSILQDGASEFFASATSEIYSYYPAAGDTHSLDTARKWTRLLGFEETESSLAVTAGAQHALLIALSACMQRGDVILAPTVVYQGLKSSAKMLGLGILPVQIDEDGIIPDELEKSLRNPRVKALFVMPNFDNPTTITMSKERRAAIARIAKAHSLILIEDDVYRPLATDDLTSLRRLYPEGTFYFYSLSKVITPGCRFGILAYPPAFANAVATASRGSVWMPERYSLAIARWLIQSGAGREILKITRKTNVTRHEIARQILGPQLLQTREEGNIIWLPMATEAQAKQMKDRLAARGVGVSASDVFKIGENGQPDGIRIYKSSAKNEDEWRIALRTIASQFHQMN